jgi:hypothetical protein
MPWWWSPFAAPLITALLATGGAWVAISFDRRKTVNEQLIRKRIELYDAMAPLLNDLYCFALSLGHWKSLTPPDMVLRKRELDRMMHVYGPLFSPDVSRSYKVLMEGLFNTFRAPGLSASLRVAVEELRFHWQSDWNDEWDPLCSTNDDAATPEAVMSAYGDLMTQLSLEIGARRPLGRFYKWRRWH